MNINKFMLIVGLIIQSGFFFPSFFGQYDHDKGITLNLI